MSTRSLIDPSILFGIKNKKNIFKNIPQSIDTNIKSINTVPINIENNTKSINFQTGGNNTNNLSTFEHFRSIFKDWSFTHWLWFLLIILLAWFLISRYLNKKKRNKINSYSGNYNNMFQQGYVDQGMAFMNQANPYIQQNDTEWEPLVNESNNDFIKREIEEVSHQNTQKEEVKTFINKGPEPFIL